MNRDLMGLVVCFAMGFFATIFVLQFAKAVCPMYVSDQSTSDQIEP
jgi:hypothetical protein